MDYEKDFENLIEQLNNTFDPINEQISNKMDFLTNFANLDKRTNNFKRLSTQDILDTEQ